MRASEPASEVSGEPALCRASGSSGSHERISIGIPLAARIIVTQHRCILSGFVGQTEREIALDEPLQRFGDMSRCLIIVDHPFEAVYRRQILPAAEIIATNLHLLSGEMVPGEVELELRVSRVFAVGETAHDIVQRLEGEFGGFLVAPDIDDLNVIRDRLQIIRISDITVAWMKLNKTVRRNNRLSIISTFVESIGRHQLALGGPDRVGVL